MSDALNLPQMITLPEASKKCGIPYCSLRKMVLEGILPHRKIGNRVYVNAAELKEVLKTH